MNFRLHPLRYFTRGSSPANDPWALSTVPSPWGKTCPPLDTHPPTSAPCRHLLLALIQGVLFPQHGTSPLLHPKLHPLDSHSPGHRCWSPLALVPLQFPPWHLALLPPLSDCLGPSPSSHQSQAPWCPESPPHSHPPSPRASLLFCLSLNPRRGVTPGPCSPLAPQSQALTTSSLQSLPFPHSRNTCPWSTVHLLSLHHPLFGSTTPVDSHYLNLVSEILVYATWSAGFSYRESSPRPPSPACWLPEPSVEV